MRRVKLSFACGFYDRTEPLRLGDVVPEGIDLEYVGVHLPREIFDRMARGQAFDAAEMSTSELIVAMSHPDCPYVAIPVFPSRAFRHGFIFYNKRSGIRTPRDLAGKRVGVGLYTQTAAIWIRGHLAHDYGVDLSTIHWVQGAIEKPGPHGDPQVHPLLQPVSIEQNESGLSLSDLLAEGRIDALIGARVPDTYPGHPDVARLFPNYREIERDFYLRTRIHPVMHTVTIKRDVYERDPWIAASLYRALEDSKNLAVQRMRFTAAPKYMLPWLYSDVDEIDEIFGGDPWPCGCEPNRPTLDALMQYMVEQHLIDKPVPLERLFVAVPEGESKMPLR